MNCDEVSASLQIFLDGELADADARELEEHLRHCEDCLAEHNVQRSYRERMHTVFPSVEAPDQLRASVHSMVSGSSADPRRRYGAPMAVGVFAAAAAAALALGLLTGGDDPTPPLLLDVAASHEKDFPLDVLGPDESSVASYFRDKVDFPVTPPVFPEDANLLGARLSTVSARDAAHLLYSVQGRKVSVMVFPSPGIQIDGAARRRIGDRDVYFHRAGSTAVAFTVDRDRGLGYATAAKVPLHEMERIVNVAYRP